jgi:hypothetical protein
MRTNRLSALCAVVSALTATSPAPAAPPVGVSPGSAQDFVSTTGRCPTFSWGAVDDALRYEVVVFDMDSGAVDAAAISSLGPQLSTSPVLRNEIPGSATSWTPDRERCLAASGRYAWVVGAATDEGTRWSAPRLFRVGDDELGRTEMEKMVEKVVERFVAEGRLADLQNLVVGEKVTSPTVPNAIHGAAEAAASATGEAAIRGELSQTTSEVYGVHGVTNSDGAGAAGILGEATNATGDSAGVRGINQSTDGAAGVFENPAGGPLLKGIGASGEGLLVDGTGAITANAFILSCNSAGTFYRDADEDAFGDPIRNAQACAAPTGYVTNSTDCDDDDAAVNPDTAEAQGTAACSDAIDNDCDGLIDELDGDCCGGALTTYSRDADEDDYGDPAVNIVTCDTTPPSGYVANDLDCDDEDRLINPDAIETCDGVDNDCDGTIDEGGNSLCNDADGCTEDACTTGQCSHTAVSCDDGLACTADACESTSDLTFTCSNVTSGSDAVCNGQCIDTQTDPNNCGSCGVQCGPNSACTQSECVCDVGFDDCNETPGCETDISSEPNCGGCGVTCFDDNECTADLCSAQACSNENLPAATPCTGGECDGQGNCVGG